MQRRLSVFGVTVIWINPSLVDHVNHAFKITKLTSIEDFGLMIAQIHHQLTRRCSHDSTISGRKHQLSELFMVNLHEQRALILSGILVTVLIQPYSKYREAQAQQSTTCTMHIYLRTSAVQSSNSTMYHVPCTIPCTTKGHIRHVASQIKLLCAAPRRSRRQLRPARDNTTTTTVSVAGRLHDNYNIILLQSVPLIFRLVIVQQYGANYGQKIDFVTTAVSIRIIDR